MDHCPHCDLALDADSRSAAGGLCPHCGKKLPSRDGTGTIEQRSGEVSQTLIWEDSPLDSTSERSEGDSDVFDADEILGDEETGELGTGTISAPGMDDPLSPFSFNADETIDGSLTELEEVVDSELFDVEELSPSGNAVTISAFNDVEPENEQRVTLDAGSGETPHIEIDASAGMEASSLPVADGGESSGTILIAPGGAERSDKTIATGQVLNQPAADTDDQESEEQPLRRTQHAAYGSGTVDVSAREEEVTDERPTHVAESEKVSTDEDGVGTVVLPGGAVPGDENAGEKTIIYDSTEQSSRATHEAIGASGTEGRLKRLWEGVAGSSANPMHSLQAVGLQAADSVFQRVATRKVADANTPHDDAADYQIIDKLGEGAMGIVFSARQTAVNRIVAIKTAKPSYQQNDESRRRFLYEAHVTADLDHSNIVPIHELGTSEEGLLFYSMKLVQGTEWSRVIRKRSREQNLEIFMKVTDAMAFAHSKGTIHRDLKPENTMLGRFGEVFVTDWGTAINLEKDSTRLAVPAQKGDKFLTVTDGTGFRPGEAIVIHDGNETFDRLQIVRVDELNPNRFYIRKKISRDYQPAHNLRVAKVINLAGTPCYMAPEMAGHQLAKISTTSDIYILGAILYDIVVGRAPHSGDSVTQCLRAALKNDIILPSNDDALLKIAYKAMATEPKDRYQTVEELQDAVREYRRHAESIALSERSDELLQQAIVQKDYETFSRSVFGYRDAIDLWPENSMAIAGLKTARLAFGQAAFAKGDYDLVFQTVDREQPEEDALYVRAVEAKKRSEGREASLRLLKRVVAAVVLFAVVGLSALSIYAFNQSARATAARRVAEEERTKAVEAETVALDAQEQALAAAASEANERMKAEVAKMDADRAAMEAREAERIARVAESDASKAQADAESAAKSELEQRRKAEAAAELAQRRAAQILIGDYKSSLALTKSQIESFDVQAGRQSLLRLQNLASEGFRGNDPDFDTWGWQRINLLSNADLPSAQIDQAVTASDYASQVDRAVIGTAQGMIQVLEFRQGKLAEVSTITEPGASISALALSPSGEEVVYGFQRGDESGTKHWIINGSTTSSVAAAGKRQFQHFTYTTDGRSLLAGINGGVWIWDCEPQWYLAQQPSRVVDSLRGTLNHLQGISAEQALLTSFFQDELLIAVLNIRSNTLKLIAVEQKLLAPLSAASHLRVGDSLMLGLQDNSLWIGKLDQTAGLVRDLEILENHHRAPVTKIVTNGTGTVITSGAEPVAHVWKLLDGVWQYDTFLTGTPANIKGMGMLGEANVVGVDDSGYTIVWDIPRQKQRRRLERQMNGEKVVYSAPVETLAVGKSDGEVLSIDRNGVVDLWSLADGSTQRFGESRWSYIGHTPGAEFVDSGIDVERGVVVTAARLRNAVHGYLNNPNHDWEFCIWDFHNGSMLRRWTAPNRTMADERVESIEQRISLVDRGRQILFASDSETRLVELESGRETFTRSDFGSYFAVTNPLNPQILMLVKRSGAVRLLDLGDDTSWEMPSLRNYALADPSDIPLRGVWSADGDRFYLTFSTGGLAAFEWSDRELVLNWSSRSLESDGRTDPLKDALELAGRRVKSHLDVDLHVTTAGERDVLHIATRVRGTNPSTRLVGMEFPISAGQPMLVSNQPPVSGVRWLQVGGTTEYPILTEQAHDVLVVDNQQVRSRVRVNNHTFVATGAAQLYGMVDGGDNFLSYGRPPLVSATGTHDGRTLFALLEDGSLWRFALDDEAKGYWSRMSYSAPQADQIDVSPDGQQLLIKRANHVRLVQSGSGEQLFELTDVAATVWESDERGRLAVCREDGSLAIVDANGNLRELAEKLVRADNSRIVGLHFFTETWGREDLAHRQHLLVHTEDADSGELRFFPIDPAPAGAITFSGVDEQFTQVPLRTKVRTSPTEGILVSGSPGGTVNVWFATPTYESGARQLFDLEGHRGADITCLHFSNDGKTIISADESNRIFAWLSRDSFTE
jgi:serine/threonine protein kinase/WD40 repeat protein